MPTRETGSNHMKRKNCPDTRLVGTMGPPWGHLPLDPPDWAKSWATSGMSLLLDVQAAEP